MWSTNDGKKRNNGMSVDVAVSPHKATTDNDVFKTLPPPPPMHMSTLAFCMGKQTGRLMGRQLYGQVGRQAD